MYEVNKTVLEQMNMRGGGGADRKGGVWRWVFLADGPEGWR